MIDSAHLDKVAESIWRATVPAAEEKGLSFSEMAESTHKVFGAMAQAALDALQLTEETRTVRSICDMADPGIPERRWVSGWVRVDGGDQ